MLANHADLATVTRHEQHVTVVFAPGVTLPAALASARKKKPDVIQLKTITPAQYDALAALIAKPTRKSRGA